jgi:hypothetical protein
MKYPIPSYAVSLWVAGDALHVAFPGTLSEQGHTITLPASAAGMTTAIKIMANRQHAKDLRLRASPATPTQYDVENDARYKAWIKAMDDGRKAAVMDAKEAEKFLEELGL